MTGPAPDPTPSRSLRRLRPRHPFGVALALLLALVATLPGGPLPAQDDGEPGPTTWGIRPSTAQGPDGRDAFTYALDPGTHVDDHVGVSNLGARPLELRVYATDAFTSGAGHFDLLPAAEIPDDVGSWITFADETVTVPPRSRLDIPFRLTVPERATPGDHAGGIVASLASTGADAAGNPLTVDRRVGARIHLRVGGELAPAATVTGVAVSYPGALRPGGTGTAQVTYTVANTGNVRLTGVPAVEVAGPFGLGRRRVPCPRLPELLPGDALTYTAAVPSVAPLGRLTATVTLAPEPVGVDSGLDVPVARGRARTWAVPWAELAAFLLLLSTAIVWRRRRRRRRQDVEARIAAARAEGAEEAAARP